MSDTPALCTRCQRSPRPRGQRWCARCRSDARREARAAQREREPAPVHPNPENVLNGGEQPEGWALGLADKVIEVTQAADAQPLKRRRPGRQLPDGWQGRFLEHYAEHGVRWRGARYAGVSHDALVAAEGADNDFARQVENARQTYLDRHALNINRLAFRQNNIVASIVALKAGRPSEYIERAISINASFSSTLDPAAGESLLRTMLGQLPQPVAPPPPGIIPVRPDPAE